MSKNIFYNGQELTLTIFYDRPCLWIKTPEQRSIPKMEFVGGYPDEWCIFLDRLTEFEKSQITSLDGSKIDIQSECLLLEIAFFRAGCM